jgi:CO/xanthine dehydrogenase Mo-binding subunit
MSEQRDEQHAKRMLSRRGFLALSAIGGTGLVLALTLPRHVGGLLAPLKEAQTEGPDLFLRISPENRVIIKVVRSEMGQGVRTALPMILAEELNADPATIVVEQGDADARYFMGTAGSQSVFRSFQLLRRAGASARLMLLQAGARRLGVGQSRCRTEAGQVIGPTGQKLSYGELAEEARQLELPPNPTLKSPQDFKLIGTDPPRYDGEDIVQGRAHFGQDVRLDGMRFASLERPPSRGAQLREYDAKAARKVPGVLDVFTLDEGVAVVAENTWAAFQGREALRVRWREGKAGRFSSEELGRRMDEALRQRGKAVREDHEAETELANADKVIEARYELPFLDQAPMIPLNCTALVSDSEVEIWAPTQFPNWARREVAHRLGLSEDEVSLHVTLIGSGFGRRIYPDVVVEAAAIARRAQVPIQLVNTREDNFRHGVYRPANRHRLRACLDERGLPRAWTHHIAGPSIAASWSPHTSHPEANEIQGAVDLPYSIENVRVAYTRVSSPLRLGAMRGVARVNNAFVTECFLDELAHAARRDPLQYRLDLLKDRPTFESEGENIEPERLIAVLKLAAKMANWGRTMPAGHGLGIAANAYGSCQTYCAEVAHVELLAEGKLRVHEVWCALDCGIVVHPDLVRAQCEGGVVYALSSILKHRLSFAKGRAREVDFRDYPLLTITEAPEVSVDFVKSERPPGGIGEPPLPPLAPAVNNAAFAACGKRARSLPIKRLS